MRVRLRSGEHWCCSTPTPTLWICCCPCAPHLATTMVLLTRLIFFITSRHSSYKLQKTNDEGLNAEDLVTGIKNHSWNFCRYQNITKKSFCSLFCKTIL